MAPEKPLTGLKIAVTRPREQAAPLARRIEEAGGVPLLFPLLDIEAVQDPRTLQEQISRLAQFDLAIFISPNAVRYGIAAIRAAGVSLTPTLMKQLAIRLSPQAGKSLVISREEREQTNRCASLTLKIATVGQGSAKALRELGIANVMVPTERSDSEGLLALPELQNVAGWRVLILRGDGGRELLGDTLKARGATVEYAACYRRSKPQQNVALLLDAAPDAITVTSSEALEHLWQMLDGAQRDRLCGLPLFVPHQRIVELAQRQGWRQVRPTDAGDDGLLCALEAWSAEGG